MRIELTQQQRIKWFFVNYYETGMELEGLQQSLKDKDLDEGIDWIDGKVIPPKYLDDIKTKTVNVVRSNDGTLLYGAIKLTQSEKEELRNKGLYIEEIKLI